MLTRLLDRSCAKLKDHLGGQVHIAGGVEVSDENRAAGRREDNLGDVEGRLDGGPGTRIKRVLDHASKPGFSDDMKKRAKKKVSRKKCWPWSSPRVKRQK